MIFKYLLIAHIMADFYLQNDETTKKKEEEFITKKNWYTSQLFKHLLVYGSLSALIFVLVQSNSVIDYAIVGAAFMSHGAIDFLKIHLAMVWHSRKKLLFIIDQTLHVTILYFTSQFIEANFFSTSLFEVNQHILKWILVILLLSNTANVIFKIMFSQFFPNNKEIDHTYLQAGQWIGILERLLIIILLSLNEFTSVGVLVSVKLYARFQQKHNFNPSHTEDISIHKLENYYILGTLYSMLYTLIIYLIFFK